MSIFSKKYDFFKDRVRMVFDVDTKSYYAFIGNRKLSNKELNRKSRKQIDEANDHLQSDSNLLNRELTSAKIRKRFDKLKDLGYSCSSFEYLGKVEGHIADEVMSQIEDYFEEDDVLLGIHRVGNVSDEVIQDILENGLIMSGHGNGSVSSSIELANNVSYYPDNKVVLKELMYANVYKNSRGSILIRIPDSELIGDIFLRKNGEVRLDSKYIIGYLPVNEEHEVTKMITKGSKNKSRS